MAKCGIKKYDNLPDHIRFLDIDAIRAAIAIKNSKIEAYKKERKKLTDQLDATIRALNSKTKRGTVGLLQKKARV